MIVGLVNVDDTPHHTLLGSIDYTFDFVPLTIFIVKIYTPNDMGDIRVTLKIVKFNLVSNDYIFIFGFNFRII